MNLMVTDFDGTFYDNNYEKNIELIKKYDNMDFVIATGRNYPSLKKDLKINCDYYICNDGGYILDSSDNLLYKNYIKSETVEIIYNRIKELNCSDYFLDNIDTFSKNIIENTNKISIKINDGDGIRVMNYLLKNLNDVYGYLSPNWINILSIDSNKSKAIDFILKLKKYNKVYVVGNDVNDYNMLKKYNGYFISDEKNKDFNTINNFLELEDIIKTDC